MTVDLHNSEVERCVSADGVSGPSNYVKHLCTVYVVIVYYIIIYFPVFRRDFVSEVWSKMSFRYLLQRFDLAFFMSSALEKKKKLKKTFLFRKNGDLLSVGC